MKLTRPALLTLLLLQAITAFSQSASEKRSFMRSLPAEKGFKLELKNRHGDINFTTWDKDSVYILAEIEAFAPSRQKLNNLLDGVRISITGTSNIIRAATEFDQSLNSLLETFKGLTGKLIDYESRLRINYFISIPSYLDISMDNQFGDVSIENNNGTIGLDLSHGDLHAGIINGITKITLNFGEAEIEYVRSAEITGTFADFQIGECPEIRINSTSSKFDVRKAGRIIIESRRDKFYAGTIAELEGKSYFTDFSIGSITRSVDLDLKYGNLETESSADKFEKIWIRSAYSDIDLAFGQGSSYRFEIRHTNAFVVLPAEGIKSERSAVNEERKEYLTTGTFGGSPGSSLVEIEANRGNIHIK